MNFPKNVGCVPRTHRFEGLIGDQALQNCNQTKDVCIDLEMIPSFLQGAKMINNFDHCTIVVKDIEATKKFFALLGFQEDFSAVISGDKFSTYMGVENIEAEHVTLVLANSSPRQEIQFLKYHNPAPLSDPNITRLDKMGYNHLCFAVDDIEQEVSTTTLSFS